MIHRIASAALRDQRAISTVEFALVAPVLLLMIMGFFDLAHREYGTAVLQGALQKAARDSTLETADATTIPKIETAVKTQVTKVLGKGAAFDPPVRLSYTDFAGIGKPETYVDKVPKNNKYDVGECYFDVNGNAKWDADLGKAGNGGAQDAVILKMTVKYPRLFPMAGLLGWSPTQAITASTVLRNQPYGGQTPPTSTQICT
jgi:Flp pilus assembly protein TadG